MKKNKNSDRDRIVYSTDLGSLRNYFDTSEDVTDSVTPKSKQVVRVTLDRKQRGGKEVTLVTGLEENDETIKELGSFLKSKCGVGGSAKNGEIVVQGDHREKVIQLLKEKGYTNTKRTGG